MEVHMDGYMWRRGFMVLLGLMVLGSVAFIAYQAGEANSTGEIVRNGHWHGHAGFGFLFFPFLLFPLGFLLLFVLMRAAFGGPPWRGGGWDREQRIEDWHRRLHERDATRTVQPADSPPAPREESEQA
jgi:hypothetical protein